VNTIISLRTWLLSLIVLLAATPVCWAATDYDGPDSGWVVFSITTSTGNPGGTDVIANFRAVGSSGLGYSEESKPLGMFGSGADLTAGSFDSETRALVSATSRALMNGPTKTDVFAVRLPPGRYEIYYLQVSGGQGTDSLTSHFTSHPIAFPINPGRTTYIGAITLAPIGVPGLFGLPRFIAWERVLIDQADRDLAIAAKRGLHWARWTV
jgi:hypothetical protein